MKLVPIGCARRGRGGSQFDSHKGLSTRFFALVKGPLTLGLKFLCGGFVALLGLFLLSELSGAFEAAGSMVGRVSVGLLVESSTDLRRDLCSKRTIQFPLHRFSKRLFAGNKWRHFLNYVLMILSRLLGELDCVCNSRHIIRLSYR